MRFVFASLLGFSFLLHAGMPSGWRGDGTGHFSGVTVPPTAWGPATGIVWERDLGAFSNATPIMLDGKLYVCAEIDELICLDAADGRVLWRQATPEEGLLTVEEKAEREKIKAQLAPAKTELDKLNGEYRGVQRSLRKDRDNEELKKQAEALKMDIDALKEKIAPLTAIELPNAHKVNGYSSPTPVTDGKNVYVMFGTGVVAAYTPEGQRLWARALEKPQHGWGHSASPVLAGDKLIAAYINVYALDLQTGKELWQVPSKAHWGTHLLWAASRVFPW